MTWEVLSGFLLTPRARARIGQKTENEFLGVGSGIMDQFICVQGQKDHLILLDCRSLDYEIIPVSEDVAIILADSGARRALTEIGYNDRPRECQVAVRLLQSHMPDIRTLRDVSPEEFERHAHRLPLSLRRRARHVISECTRVLDGAEALRQGNIVAFGELMQKSQASSRDNYENSIAEFDFLASMASQLDGCYGARFAGGGFGGMMQILADRSAVGRLQQTLQRAFKAEFKRELPTLRCTLAAGAQHFRL
jgi:galactokinase